MTHQNQGLPFAVVDVETTGFSNRDRVLEVAVVHADGDGTVTGRWSTLVNPRCHIPNTHVHGITAARVAAAPLFSDIAAELVGQLEGRIFVAHNAPFDSRLLTAEFGRLGLAPDLLRGSALCTLALTGRLSPASGRGLSAALAAAGITNDRAHAAEGDAVATARLLRHYLHRSPSVVAEMLHPLHPVTLTREDAAVLAGVTPGNDHPVPLLTRDLASAPVTAARDGGWLNQLATGVPVVGEPNVDDYLDLLAAAMLDRELSVHEITALTACADDLGIGREEAVAVHTGFVRQLAVLAWADGTVTPEEREELHSAAKALGVDRSEVDRWLDSPDATAQGRALPELRLQPGDRVTFTGETEIPRATWEARAREAGLDVGGVTRRSVLLVAADPDTGSAKATKARGLGVPVVTESGFARLLGELENTGSGDIDPRRVISVSHPAADGDLPAGDDCTAGDLTTTFYGEPGDPADPGVPVPGPVTPGPESSGVPDTPAPSAVPDGTAVDAALGTALDTALGLLGFLARTHGSLRAAVEHGGVSAVDGELPSHVEALLSRAGDPTGSFRRVVGERRGTVAGILGAFWRETGDRDRLILRERIVATDRATLAQIADLVGVTRERVRQVQNRLIGKLTEISASGPVADLLAGIRAHAHPVNTLEAVTTVFPELAETLPGWEVPLWQILDALDDDFRVDDGWVCFPDLQTAAQRTGSLLATMVNAEGVAEVSAVLAKSSIDSPDILENWLTTCGYLVTDGHVLTRVGSQAARAAALLSVVGHPMTVADMYTRLNDAKTERSFRNGLARGGDLVRVGMDSWALKRWGLEEYTGIADLIGRRVDAAVAAGREGVAVDDLIDDLTREFGVSASSVRTYAASGEFTSTGGTVRRRTEPVVNSADPAESNGLYMRDGRWCLLLTVTADHLRGSGFTVPNGLTTGLDLAWNEPLMLPSDLGEHRVTWGGIGNSSVGSIRRHLEELGCRAGDRVWIDLHDGERFTVTPAAPWPAQFSGDGDGDGDMAWLAHHVGADPSTPEDARCSVVAEALGLAPDAPRRKILSRFRHRSDQEAVQVLEKLWM